MKRTKGNRIQVRPVNQASIADKRFKRIFITSKRVASRKVHPQIVLADLREGSLVSLNRYLAQEGGIPHRAVAVELRKLIAGSVHRSHYRLGVFEHPDRTKNTGGHPSSVQNKGTLERQRIMYASYERALSLCGQRANAEMDVSDEFNCDPTTVRRAVTMVQQEIKRGQDQALRDESAEQKLAAISTRRDNALRNLREDGSILEMPDKKRDQV